MNRLRSVAGYAVMTVFWLVFAYCLRMPQP